MNVARNKTNTSVSYRLIALVVMCLGVFGATVLVATKATNSDLKEAQHLQLVSQASQSSPAPKTVEVLPDEFNFVVDDVDVLKDTIIKYVVELGNENGSEKIEVRTSDSALAKIINPGNVDYLKVELNDLDTAYIRVTGFGRSVITAQVVDGGPLITSFPIYVGTPAFEREDTVYNINIFSHKAATFLDPMQAGKNQYKATYDFYAIAQQLATANAEFDWSVKSKEKVRIEPSVTGDTAKIYFPQGGRYKVQLLQKSNKALLDELEFTVKLNEGITADTNTGFLSSILDPRDGNTYRVSLYEKSGDSILFFRDDLRYMPYVQPASKVSGVIDYPLIMVFGNKTDYNRNAVLEKFVKKDSTVMYNYLADYEKGGSPQADESKICPEGWVIPTIPVLQKYIGDDGDPVVQSVLDTFDIAGPHNKRISTSTSNVFRKGRDKWATFAYDGTRYRLFVVDRRKEVYIDITGSSNLFPVRCYKKIN